MNREKAKELLKGAKEALTHATAFRDLLESFPYWEKIGNYFNFVDGLDEIRAKIEVLKLFADESAHVNDEDLKEVIGWLTRKED